MFLSRAVESDYAPIVDLINLAFRGVGGFASWNSEADFITAYAAAEAANSEAGRLRNQWTAAPEALADARKAANRRDFDHAVASAKEAEALAKASISQATSEKDAWKNLEIR